MQKKISTSLVTSILLVTTNLFSVENLESITVTSATKSEQSIKDVTSNVEVITKEEIEERHFTTVAEALNTLTGISVISNGGMGTQTSVMLRGMDSKRVLVLIDGIRYNDFTNTNGAPFEHLMIDNIQQIEVVKGAQSGIWGADASAGVINIITNGSKMGTHGEGVVEAGSFNSKKYGMNLSHRTEKFYINGSAYQTETDGYSAFLAKRSSKNYGTRGDMLGLEDDGYENLSASLKAGYNVDDSNKVEVSHSILDADVDTDSSTADALSTYKTNDKFSSASYQNKNVFATTDLYLNNSVYDREYYDSTKKTISYYDGTVDEYGLKSEVPYLNNSSFVIVGADYKTFEHENNINEKFNNKGLFTTNSNKFFENKTIITESLRNDDYDKFDDKTTGKVGIKQYIWNELNVSSNYGTAYNVPTLFNLYDSIYGNKNLTPETTKSYDIGLEYKGISTTYFNTKIDDMIEYNTTTSKYANVLGTSTLKGYELGYKNSLDEDTFFNIGYTSLNAKDNKGQDLARRPQDSVKLGVDYYGIEKWHLNLNGEYIGDRYDSANKAGANTGNYYVFNSVADYEIDKTFSTYFKLNNIFNRYYQTIDGYATAERSAYVGLKAKF